MTEPNAAIFDAYRNWLHRTGRAASLEDAWTKAERTFDRVRITFVNGHIVNVEDAEELWQPSIIPEAQTYRVGGL